jgi:uncharacterized protein (DUF697 family)
MARRKTPDIMGQVLKDTASGDRRQDAAPPPPDSGASESAAAVADAELPPTDNAPDRQREAMAIVDTNVWWAMGTAAIPFPLVDLALLTVLHTKMLSRLAERYQVPFSNHVVKSVLFSLLVDLGAATLSRSALSSAIRLVPVVGPLLSWTVLPLANGAATYALGKVFIQHFESGGTFLDVDLQALGSELRHQYQRAAKRLRQR